MTSAASNASTSTATLPHTSAEHRLRQIAILVSSVDAAAARQILHHLPTEKVKQVRALINQLGNVSAEEKRKILADFQRSAASSGSRKSSMGTTDMGPTAATGPQRASVEAFFSNPSLGSSEQFSSANRSATYFGNEPTADSSASQSAWTQMSTAALLHFLRGERSAVIAVVVSQLAPHVAVEVLQHLSQETSREVLLRLSRLQEIDPEAMQTIDEHLSQRLQEYQHHIQSEFENSRRIHSLLAAAPPALRHDWGALLGRSIPESTPAESRTAEVTQTPQQPPANDQSTEVNRDAASESTSPPQSGDILPFPRVTKETRVHAMDHGLIQIEFEQILQLPPTALAHLLSNIDSRTVLLALAGASPEFMKRFYRMLDRQDAKALSARLQRIGVIQLRDVDDAQRRVVEQATRLPGVHRTSHSESGQARRAA